MQANSFDSPAALGGNREEIRDVLTILEPEETPYTSMVRKGQAPISTTPEVMASKLRAPRLAGTKEGTDAQKGGNKAKNRKRFAARLHRSMEEFSVTDVQQIISEHGGNAATDNEYGDSKAQAIREVKRDFEAVSCSAIEGTAGGDDAMTTRGMFVWMDVSGGSLMTRDLVPAEFRTPSAQVKTGITGGTRLTEAYLNALLKSLKSSYGGKREFQMIAGNNIVEDVDNFTRTEGGVTAQRYTVNEMASTHEINLMVQVFNSSFGRVNSIPTEFNNCSPTTGLGDANAAAILNMDLWEHMWFDPLHSKDLQEEGGGPAGFVKAIFANGCRMPKGNAAVFNGAQA